MDDIWGMGCEPENPSQEGKSFSKVSSFLIFILGKIGFGGGPGVLRMLSGIPWQPGPDSWQAEAVLESCPNNGLAKYVALHIKKGLGENHHE